MMVCGPGLWIILGILGIHLAVTHDFSSSEVEDNVDRDVDGDEEAASYANVANFDRSLNMF